MRVEFVCMWHMFNNSCDPMPGLLTTWSGWLMRQEVQVSSRLAIKPPDGQLAIRPDESNRGEKFHKVQQVCYIATVSGGGPGSEL